MSDAPPAQWSGVPPGPERFGHYWMYNERDGWEVWRWYPDWQCWWTYQNAIAPLFAVKQGWKCIGLALTPAEVAERERAAELRGFEAAIEWLERVPKRVPTIHSLVISADVVADACRYMRAELARQRETQRIAQETACSERTMEGYVDSTEQALTRRREEI